MASGSRCDTPSRARLRRCCNPRRILCEPDARLPGAHRRRRAHRAAPPAAPGTAARATSAASGGHLQHAYLLDRHARAGLRALSGGGRIRYLDSRARGHGESERPSCWTMEDWIRHDAPAALDQVLDATGARDCFWVGHSAGGVVGAAMVGAFPRLTSRLRGLVLVGAPGPAGVSGLRRWMARSGHLAAGLFPRTAVPGTLLGLGPEPEPTPLIRQWMGWNLLGAWRGSDGSDYLDVLDRVEVPLLAVAGAGDRWLAPPEAVRNLAERFGSEDSTLVVAGTRQGFRENYGHAELIVSRSARQEIWPLLSDWLAARADG
ncbi:MAG TPA: alpha/beta fold hydrolase [Longimicrobiaceae bacterium]|nr:alpha/beta fold hydrolase [Longimicrobiaceae bacterium]